MTKKLVGLVASVALLGSGMALAHDEKIKGQQDQQSQQQQPLGGDAFGGSGSQDTMGGSQQGQVGSSKDEMGGSKDQMATADVGEKEVTGTVVKSSRRLIHLRTDNGIIPIKVDKATQLDPSVKNVRDLKEGQQVRASFDMEGTDNVAKSIKLDTGTGGSMMDDSGINQDTGGSGLGGQDKGDIGGGDVGGDMGGDKGHMGGDTGHMGGDTGNKGDKSY